MMTVAYVTVETVIKGVTVSALVGLQTMIVVSVTVVMLIRDVMASVLAVL